MYVSLFCLLYIDITQLRRGFDNDAKMTPDKIFVSYLWEHQGYRRTHAQLAVLPEESQQDFRVWKAETNRLIKMISFVINKLAAKFFVVE